MLILKCPLQKLGPRVYPVRGAMNQMLVQQLRPGSTNATPCDTWRTLQQRQPYCDPPDSSSKWAVNLDKVLGPMCSEHVDGNGCCYVPLSYSGGPDFGTPCTEACGPRAGSDKAFCQRSDQSEYGNCFCGGLSNASRLGIRGVNYGGRFVAEHWMNLPGMAELYGDATPGGSCQPHACALSTCDMAATANAGTRMRKYLDASISEDAFASIAAAGFNFIRLPLGYWHLIQPAAPPDAPNATATRWLALQQMLKPEDYSPFISRVVSFARKHGLRVLFDLHGAPGGQSTNQCTGCATGCEGSGCSSKEYYFNRESNYKVGLQAVVELAKWCVKAAETCYGIELLNEPDGDLDRKDLLYFYQRAVKAARGDAKLPPHVPIVVMDWVLKLDTFWSTYKDSLGALVPRRSDVGTLQFETHIYVPASYDSIATLEVQALPMLAILRRFANSAGANYSTFIGEWTISKASGSLSLEEVARWWYTEAAKTSHGHGLSIWNYDGPGGWGAIVPNGDKPRTWWPGVNKWPAGR